MPNNRALQTLLALTLAGLVSACGPAAIPNGINDPHEASNRKVHAFNQSLDKALVRPVSKGYGGVLPKPVRIGVGNFARNVDLPRVVVNDILQFRPVDAVHNTWRFAVNTTIGLGGFLDPATAMGLDQRNTDFGATLYVWGVPEGTYQEIPFGGPSTQRGTVGALVDFALNPLSYVLPAPEHYVVGASWILSDLDARYTFGSTVDSILYDSADSYAQARILYLQNRRYELRQIHRGANSGADTYLDPYASDSSGNGASAASGDGSQYLDPYSTGSSAAPAASGTSGDGSQYIDPYEAVQ